MSNLLRTGQGGCILGLGLAVVAISGEAGDPEAGAGCYVRAVHPQSPHLPGFQHSAQLQCNLGKGGALIRTVPPALTHQLISVGGALLR